MREETTRLIEMVNRGVPGKEIVEELGVKTKASLKRMYYDALVEAGKIRGIVTQREAQKARARSGTLSITKRGTITLGNRLLIDNLGFKEGDKFTVSKKEGQHHIEEKRRMMQVFPTPDIQASCVRVAG